MPQATQQTINGWKARLFDVATTAQLGAFYDEVLGYDLPDPEPSQDQGAEMASVRSQAIALLAIAMTRVAQLQAGISHPLGAEGYRATRKVPIAGQFLVNTGIDGGEGGVLIALRSMLDVGRAPFFERPGITPGHATMLHAPARAKLTHLLANPIAPGLPGHAQWIRNVNHQQAIVDGNYPGEWQIRAPGTFGNFGVTVF